MNLTEPADFLPDLLGGTTTVHPYFTVEDQTVKRAGWTVITEHPDGTFSFVLSTGARAWETLSARERGDHLLTAVGEPFNITTVDTVALVLALHHSIGEYLVDDPTMVRDIHHPDTGRLRPDALNGVVSVWMLRHALTLVDRADDSLNLLLGLTCTAAHLHTIRQVLALADTLAGLPHYPHPLPSHLSDLSEPSE